MYKTNSQCLLAIAGSFNKDYINTNINYYRFKNFKYSYVPFSIVPHRHFKDAERLYSYLLDF